MQGAQDDTQDFCGHLQKGSKRARLLACPSSVSQAGAQFLASEVYGRHKLSPWSTHETLAWWLRLWSRDLVFLRVGRGRDVDHWRWGIGAGTDHEGVEISEALYVVAVLEHVAGRVLGVVLESDALRRFVEAGV